MRFHGTYGYYDLEVETMAGSDTWTPVSTNFTTTESKVAYAWDTTAFAAVGTPPVSTRLRLRAAGGGAVLDTSDVFVVDNERTFYIAAIRVVSGCVNDFRSRRVCARGYRCH